MLQLKKRISLMPYIFVGIMKIIPLLVFLKMPLTISLFALLPKVFSNKDYITINNYLAQVVLFIKNVPNSFPGSSLPETPPSNPMG
jgi:hypothetical protein